MQAMKKFYDVVYRIVLVICKLLLIADILITTEAILGRYVPFLPDPSWSEEMVLTLMSYMAVLSAALAIRRKAHIRMTSFDGPDRGSCSVCSRSRHAYIRLDLCLQREGVLPQYSDSEHPV